MCMTKVPWMLSLFFVLLAFNFGVLFPTILSDCFSTAHEALFE